MAFTHEVYTEKERLSDHTSIPPTSTANQNAYVNNQNRTDNRTRSSRKLPKDGVACYEVWFDLC